MYEDKEPMALSLEPIIADLPQAPLRDDVRPQLQREDAVKRFGL